MEGGNNAGQQVGADGRRQANAHDASEALADIAGAIANALRVAEHAPADFHDLGADGRYHNSRPGALHELGAQALIEGAQLSLNVG